MMNLVENIVLGPIDFVVSGLISILGFKLAVIVMAVLFAGGCIKLIIKLWRY